VGETLNRPARANTIESQSILDARLTARKSILTLTDRMGVQHATGLAWSPKTKKPQCHEENTEALILDSKGEPNSSPPHETQKKKAVKHLRFTAFNVPPVGIEPTTY
jgi:hypothetical protein